MSKLNVNFNLAAAAMLALVLLCAGQTMAATMKTVVPNAVAPEAEVADSQRSQRAFSSQTRTMDVNIRSCKDCDASWEYAYADWTVKKGEEWVAVSKLGPGEDMCQFKAECAGDGDVNPRKPCRVVFKYEKRVDVVDGVAQYQRAEDIYDFYWDGGERRIAGIDKPLKGAIWSGEGPQQFSFTPDAKSKSEEEKIYCVEIVAESNSDLKFKIDVPSPEVGREGYYCRSDYHLASQKLTYRCYFGGIRDTETADISVSLQDKDWGDDEGKNNATFYSTTYSISVRNVQPIITIHELGDKPEYDGEKSYHLDLIRMDAPYCCEFVPMQAHEFPWNAKDKESLSDYAGDKEGQLGQFIDRISRKYSLKPLLICHGVGGLIAAEQIMKDGNFWKKVQKVMFGSTPFFGTELATELCAVDGIELSKLVNERYDRPLITAYAAVSKGILKELSHGKSDWERYKDLKKHSEAFDRDSVYIEIGKLKQSALEDLISDLQDNLYSVYEMAKLDRFFALSAAGLAISGAGVVWTYYYPHIGLPVTLTAIAVDGIALLYSYFYDKAMKPSRTLLCNEKARNVILDGTGITSAASADPAKILQWTHARNKLLSGYESHSSLYYIFRTGKEPSPIAKDMYNEIKLFIGENE